MHRSIRTMGLVLMFALLSASVHAQTSSNDLRRWLLDFTRWSSDVLNVGTAVSNAYASEIIRSSGPVSLSATGLDADTRLRISQAFSTAEDLTSRYGPLLRNVSITESNMYLVRAVNAGQRAVNYMRMPLMSLGISRIQEDEWESALRDFSVYSELSGAWLAIHELFQR